ncbi:desmethylxanthohumol 6'-O-methyltransferase [Vitis vinifera]|nr:desmethylxanthohumol 6'-O-methyltransferase [Vitis vinifera]|eukprot:XP_002277602.1 PREDICTED: (R,S)-reticuline 7-O-methyltransferase [Vitis vinifera]
MDRKQKMVSRSENDDVLKISREADEAELMLQGQANIWRHMFAFADSMVLKCALELRIADIIHSHARPITLSQIATCIDSPSPDITCLARIMRFLVCAKIFTAAPPPQSDGGETLYGLTPSSKWLLHDAELSLAPMVLMENHPFLMAPWHCLGTCVKEGGIAFEKAHGRQIWDFASENPEFNKLFNDGMACTAKVVMGEVVAAYKDGFGSIRTLVDVGGGTGGAVAEVVKAYPHIKGINFDLPHVVASAPAYEGVSHVGGDMFESIPNADAIFMKWIMHDWSDEDCIKILKNCRKAVPEKTGKIIIVDGVIREDSDDPFDKTRLVFDLLMIAHSSNGKERSEVEWKKVLEEGGFPRYRILEISISTLPMIIEAYPE